MADVPHEVELRLRIAPGSASKLLAHPAVAGVKRARARTTKLRSIYFDTPDARLAAAGVALRLRHDGRGWLQTVKGPATATSGAGLTERVECEWRIARSTQRPRLDLARLSETPYRRAIQQATRHAPLAPVFATRFERTTIPLRFPDSTTAQLSLDRGLVHAGERASADAARETITEVEIELETGDAARLFDLAIALSADLPVAVESRSKAQRGYGLVARRPVAAVHAEPVSIPADGTVAEAMAAVLRSCLRQIDANAAGVHDDDDPECVHQLRVGVRRVRCALSILKDALPGELIGPLREQWRWLARELGRVRDLDVFAGDTLPAVASALASENGNEPSHAAAIDALAALTRERAAQARRQARDAIASQRFAKLVLVTGRLATAPSLGIARNAPQHALLQQPVRAFAAEHLRRTHRRLARAARRLPGSEAERHELRIRAKRVRYAAEFFAPLYADKHSHAYRNALASLQEALGAANDAAVANSLAEELASGSPAASLVQAWVRVRRDACVDDVQRAWRKLKRSSRFWTGR